jgi:glucose/arabinose dehydrogenase
MKRFPVLAAAAVAALFPLSAVAQTFGPAGAYFIETYASGLSQPTTMAFVSPNTVLVFEKGTGIVKRVVNGVVQAAPAIDLPVNNSSERGGLGICISPNFASDNFVYLYYSHATTQGGTWTGNRVERFIYNAGAGTLTFDQSIIEFAMDPSQGNGPNHDGGIIMIGPDDKLYIITGDLNRGQFGNPRIEQNTSTSNTAVAAVGGIHRLNLDGSIPADNPFFAHPSERIRTYWAYGIRNSFGMTYDPLTDYIWFSENGPTVYDELNVVPSGGMNSGWLKIMGPDSRNATYSLNGNQNWEANQLTILTNSYYRDPEFSWLSPNAVTSMLVATTPKVREEERDQMFVGDNNFGNLYLFQMNPARDGFVLSGAVADKVADSSTERNLNVFGTGWGVTTDMEIGPDGYIYVVGLSGGVIRRIRPTLEHLGPNDFQVMPGIISGGNLASLQESDDVRLNMRPGIVFSTSQAPISLFVETTSPFTTIPASFELMIESQATSGTIQQTIALELDNGGFEIVDTRNLTTTDGVATVTINSNVADYIRPDGTIRARVNFRATGPVFAYPWEGRVDQALFSIQR